MPHDSEHEEDVNRAAERIREKLEQHGFQIAPIDGFFEGIHRLYVYPTVDEVVREELPLIYAAYPDAFARQGIDLMSMNVAARLEGLYGPASARGRQYGKELLKRVSHTFKVDFRHIRYFLIDDPDALRAHKNIRDVLSILNGSYMPEEFRIVV